MGAGLKMHISLWKPYWSLYGCLVRWHIEDEVEDLGAHIRDGGFAGGDVTGRNVDERTT